MEKERDYKNQFERKLLSLLSKDINSACGPNRPCTPWGYCKPKSPY